MKVLFVLSAACAMAYAVPAAAVGTSLGAVNSGPVDVRSSYAAGYKLYNFDDGTSPFTGGGVRSGLVQNQYVPPFGDTTPYFSVGPSTSSPASLTLSGINQLSFYWGSIDTYNTITFEGLGQTFSGAAFGGTDSSNRISREITFSFTPAEAAALTGITLRSNTNAFELDNLIFGSAAPEPATWAMMILGFGIAGYTLRLRKRPTARFATAAA